MVQLNKEASQTRDCYGANKAPHRAARPDPSLRKRGLLRMTGKLHRYHIICFLDFTAHAE
jgi:hypothetical protein